MVAERDEKHQKGKASLHPCVVDHLHASDSLKPPADDHDRIIIIVIVVITNRLIVSTSSSHFVIAVFVRVVPSSSPPPPVSPTSYSSSLRRLSPAACHLAFPASFEPQRPRRHLIGPFLTWHRRLTSKDATRACQRSRQRPFSSEATQKSGLRVPGEAELTGAQGQSRSSRHCV